jgi:heparosan-N-sulfate-glucuronate 5-epimerase
MGAACEPPEAAEVARGDVLLMRNLVKPRQLAGTFVPGDPHSGYYNDLRVHVAAHANGAGPAAALRAFEWLTRDRTLVNPVAVVQLGIGAWMQLDADTRWREVVARTADWTVREMDAEGLIPFLWRHHTFPLDPSWYSALSQGEAASFLVRAARTLEEPELEAVAARAATSLIDSRLGLVAETPEGPVLQEYPTDPPSHVLNGWIYALWGLYDLSVSLERPGPYEEAFAAGVEALCARLPLYEIARKWSKYDLFPHPVANIASPFYHRLHIELLTAMDALAHRDAFVRYGAKWAAGADDAADRAIALARKVMFRIARPRSALLKSLYGRPSGGSGSV